jgi:hypothetical protein
MSAVLKTCPCCRLELTLTSWRALPFLGYLDAGDPEYQAELRNCGCRSSIAVLCTDIDAVADTQRPTELGGITEEMDRAVDHFMSDADRLLHDFGADPLGAK